MNDGNMYDIIDYRDKSIVDENNYAYAVCSCLKLNEGIAVPRQDHYRFVKLNCPKCGMALGINVLGKEDIKQRRL